MAEKKAHSFLHMIRRSQRGRLKLYLGYCAGVGKTYQMLEEAHRLKKEGIDVVVGLVETHGRPETAALLDGLEVLPRRRKEYHSIQVEEMDADAVLARKPQVVLVDELAHTNVPGSRNPKRYQDVQDILAAGIHVISTMNVQHLESLYDTVEKIAGIKVRERLPDTVIADSDEIVNVDLTTEDLQKRIDEGKVYPKERIETAFANFFKASNLEQLRELTLRETASQIDLRRRESLPPEAPATPDQVMVCLSSAGPNSEKLLRYASRLAGRLNRNWYAVYVQTPSEEPTVIDSHVQRILSSTLTLAKQLGALVFTYKGEDIPGTILRFAKEYRVGHIVIGSPGPMPFRKRLMKGLMGKKNIVERLIEGARGVTVVVLDTRKHAPVPETAASEFPEGPAEEPAPQAAVPAGVVALGKLLSPRRIRIWDEPVSKQEVIEGLVEAAGKDPAVADVEAMLHDVLENEEKGTTFLNEGVAFPHARVEGLSVPLVALGLTRKGVRDVSTDNPMECVFLILSPRELAELQVRVLGLVSRAAQSRYLLKRLASSRTPEQALAAILDWEALEGQGHADLRR